MLAIAFMINFAPLVYSAGLPLDSMLISKRLASASVTDLSSEDGYTDYQSGIRYDEYPVSFSELVKRQKDNSHTSQTPLSYSKPH